MPDQDIKPLIYDLDITELADTLASWGEPRYRADQVWLGLYKSLWTDSEEFSTLSKSLRTRLADHFAFSHLQPAARQESSDRETIKTLFQMPDGQGIEAVLMQYSRRRTLCISSQAGCAMGCVFCATGQMGFQRNLSAGEIIEQVVYYARYLKSKGEKTTNIVVMGMGEPFHNYDATLAAIDRLNNPNGFNFGARRFTISTVGLVPAIRRFTLEHRQVNLAISLHAANDDLRSFMLPINKKYPLDELIAACQDYVQNTGRRITFEWALINDVNDTPDHAKQLADLVKGLLCHVNIIPLNPTRFYSGKATTKNRADEFKQTLANFGIPCTIRIRRGIDIQAGCGQLATAQF